MRAPFSKFKQFVSRKPGLAAIAGLSVLLAVIASASVATAVRYTSSPDFCAKGCHEMESTVSREYTHSRHYDNGQAATCAQCHNRQDNLSHALQNQLSGASHVWVHLVDRTWLPGRFEARRAMLAKRVLAGFEASNAAECKSCHAYAAMARTDKSADARRDHAAAMKTDANCLNCHRNVAHARTDAPASYDY